jgi:hypothetical protein
VPQRADQILDASRLREEALAFLTAHNDRWRQPWDTFPLLSGPSGRSAETSRSVWFG